MKIFKKIIYIVLIVIITILFFVLYSQAANNKEPDAKEKVTSELNYFESKLIYIFNSLNNIEFDNYKISSENINEKTKDSKENISSKENSSGEENSEGGSGDSSEKKDGKDSSSQNQSSDSTSSNSKDDAKKFSLNMKGIFNDDKKINWDYIKNEIEILQASLPTITLDLYQINVENSDILNFNREFNNLLLTIKNESKENTLNELVNIYLYMPKFYKKCNVDEIKEIVIKTKYKIFKAYSLLDKENWEEISINLQDAINIYSKMLTNVDIKSQNQYFVNKCYVSLNELQNSINTQDKEIFLIKYKNLIEEINNL